MKAFGLLVLMRCGPLLAHAQNRIPMLGESAPAFKSSTTSGELSFPGDFGDSWKIHPMKSGVYISIPWYKKAQ